MQLKPFALDAPPTVTGASFAGAGPVIGLITETEISPPFVKMKEGAKATDKGKAARLLIASGRSDGDSGGLPPDALAR